MAMKLKFLLYTAIALASVTTASAKEDENPESNHVVVTLADGSTVDGYLRNDFKTGLKNFFSKTGTIKQYINIGKERKGGETKRYSAKDVKEYRFTEATEAFPEGAVFVSEYINTPAMFKPHKCKRGFAQELNRTDCGKILQWTGTVQEGGRNVRIRYVPVIGVKFNGAKATYSLFIDGNHSNALLLNYLKKQAPELKKVIEQYFNKGKDAKMHRKELAENPSIILDLYAQYLRDHEPINDPEEDKDRKGLADEEEEEEESAPEENGDSSEGNNKK